MTPKTVPSPAHPDHQTERNIVIVLLGLMVLWALIDVVRSYPATFHPRLWDEAVYAWDAIHPDRMLGEQSPDAMQYAPAKLGYGLPLAGAVWLLGENGVMYFSTFCWLMTIALVTIACARWFGGLMAALAAAILSYSPLFGKYIAEAGPTTLASLGFVLLWIVFDRRQFWLTGIVVAMIAFIDFKWALPVGVSIIHAEVTVKSGITLRRRLLNIIGTGIVAVGLLALVVLIHPPYFDFFSRYTFGHSRLMSWEPSIIFVVYLLIFGGAPVAIVALVSYLALVGRRAPTAMSDQALARLWTALLFGGVPVVFYSLFGIIKGLRFFAVSFPLLAVVAAIGAARAVQWLLERVSRITSVFRGALATMIGVMACALIVIGSDGPARHLRLATGIHEALLLLGPYKTKQSTVSSYIWPVVHYDWRVPTERPPFALWGVLRTDRWVLLDPIIDHSTICLRSQLSGQSVEHADSLLDMQRRTLLPLCDSLFSLRNDYYASDYFLAEHVTVGFETFERLRRTATGDNYLSVYQFDTAMVTRRLQQLNERN